MSFLSLNTYSSLSHSFLTAEEEWHVQDSGLLLPLLLLFMSDLLRVCSLQPRDIHSLQMQLAKHLQSLWSALSFFLALTCPSFFWKERGYTSANETMTGLGRLWTVWRLGVSGTHTMKGRCSLSVKFSSLLQPGRLAWIIEKVYHCSKESLLVIVITAAPKTSPLHASVTEIFTIT